MRFSQPEGYGAKEWEESKVFFVNLEKYVKDPLREWTFADWSEVPSRARSAHIVGHYIKVKKMHYTEHHSSGGAKLGSFSMRLEGISHDDMARERVERKVREANQQWHLANTPLRMRMV